MAVSGISPGDYFTSSKKTFWYPGDVNGHQVIIGVEPVTTPLDIYIIRPNNDFYFPVPADNGGNQFKLNQDIYVAYPNGKREVYRYDGTQPVLLDTWYGDDLQRPTIWVVPTVTVNSWANPESPTVFELNAAYESIVSEDSRVIGDVLKLATSGAAYVRFDTQDGTENWLLTDNTIGDIDATAYVITSGSNVRDSAPVPADVGATSWEIGSRIEKILPNGVIEIYKANANTTASFVRSQLPTEPFTSHPEPAGWKAGEIYRYLDTSEAVHRLQRFRWVSQAGTLIPYEILGSAS